MPPRSELVRRSVGSPPLVVTNDWWPLGSGEASQLAPRLPYSNCGSHTNSTGTSP
jgi:hypothetical protein